MAKFEAHLTMDLHYAEPARKVAETYGWTYSQIAGCPLLGQGTYCYLTHYNKEAHVLKAQMEAIQRRLTGESVPILRAKIERIVYDTRTGVDELGFM